MIVCDNCVYAMEANQKKDYQKAEAWHAMCIFPHTCECLHIIGGPDEAKDKVKEVNRSSAEVASQVRSLGAGSKNSL